MRKSAINHFPCVAGAVRSPLCQKAGLKPIILVIVSASSGLSQRINDTFFFLIEFMELSAC